MSSKLEIELLRADLGSVDELLRSIPKERVISRAGLSSRREEILEELAALEEAAARQQQAEVTLLFEGAPVLGNRAIDAKFFANMVDQYQGLLAVTNAARTRPLKTRGIAPGQHKMELFVTDLPRGSFGVQLEEHARIAPLLGDSSLKRAAEEVAELLGRAADDDDDAFADAVSRLDSRVLAKASKFMKRIYSQGATVRMIVGPNFDQAFDAAAVHRAAERLSGTRVDRNVNWHRGRLLGGLPESHLFEFEFAADSRVIRGRIDLRFSDDERDLLEVFQEFVFGTCQAQLERTQISEAGRTLERWVLRDLRSISTPPATAVDGG